MKLALTLSILWRIISGLFLAYIIYKILPQIIESFRGVGGKDLDPKDELAFNDIIQKKKRELSSQNRDFQNEFQPDIRKSKFIQIREKYEKELAKFSSNMGSKNSRTQEMNNLILFWKECQWGEGPCYKKIERLTKNRFNQSNLNGITFHQYVLKVIDFLLGSGKIMERENDLISFLEREILRDLLFSDKIEFANLKVIFGFKEKTSHEDFLLLRKGLSENKISNFQKTKLWINEELETLLQKKTIKEKNKSRKEEIEKDPKLAKAYKILQLDYVGSQEELKKNFNRLAKKYHPDAKANEGNSGHEAFLTLRESYDLIKKYLQKTRTS